VQNGSDGTLLGGLTYLNEQTRWKGKLQWYTHPQAAIQMYNNHTLQIHPGTWQKQRDKGVWDMMVQTRRKWDGRLTLNHVESHVDKKRDKRGNKRTPTPING